MASHNRTTASEIGRKVVDIPTAPTIGTATAGQESASITFTNSTVGGPYRSYIAKSNPSNITATGSTSPINVTGLTAGTSYTISVAGVNETGTGEYSSASNSAVPVANTSYESIATTTLSSTTDSITFSSIPATFTHLQLRLLARTSRAVTDDGFEIQLNGDTGTNYRYHYLNGSGTTTFAYTEGSMTGLVMPVVAGASTGANIFGIGIIDILDYTNTNKYTVTRALGGIDNNGSGAIRVQSGLWLNTAAVTSLKIQTNALGDFVQYSQFALYGIKGA